MLFRQRQSLLEIDDQDFIQGQRFLNNHPDYSLMALGVIPIKGMFHEKASAFCAFLLAARAADSDHLAEGQWESLFQIESSSTDGKKQYQQTAPIYPPSRCVKGGESTPMVFFSHPEDPECKTVSLKAEKGKIRLTRLCHSASNPMATIGAKSHHASLFYDLIWCGICLMVLK